jgi:ABC-type lipoprotein export system ATPase subunit
MVTHDREAAAYGDRILHIRDGLLESQEQVRSSYAVFAKNA